MILCKDVGISHQKGQTRPRAYQDIGRVASALQQHENSQIRHDGLLPVPIGAFVAAHLNYLGGYPVQFEIVAQVVADLGPFSMLQKLS
jgi:hypothetical protein